MKPRLKSADLTQEDWLVWLHARHGFHELPWLALVDGYESADRRDADLMFEAACWSDMLGRFVRNRPPVAAPFVDTSRYHYWAFHEFLAFGKRPTPPDITNFA